jgi:hypothetical protein
MRKKILFVAAAICTGALFADQASAATVVLPAGISEISGDFPSDPFQSVFIPISIENIAPVPYLAGRSAGRLPSSLTRAAGVDDNRGRRWTNRRESTLPDPRGGVGIDGAANLQRCPLGGR